MNEDRLESLIEAYGAEPARWPAGEREDAERYLLGHAPAQAKLDVERALDEALDAWTAPTPTAGLRERVLAAAPAARGVRTHGSWRGLWLSGAGLAAACAAGAIVGATLIGPGLAGAFPSDRGEESGLLSDGVIVFGSPLDLGAGG